MRTSSRAAPASYTVHPLGEELVIHAERGSQRFSPHAHSVYVLGYVQGGSLEFECQGRTWTACSNSTVLVAPDEVHTGSSCGSNGWNYWSARVSVDFLHRSGAANFRCEQEVPSLRHKVSLDPMACSRTRAFFEAVCRGADAPHVEEALIEALAALFAGGQIDHAGPARDSRRFKTAADYMLGSLGQPLRLVDVAREAGVSPEYLTRLFKARTGLSTHQWFVQKRFEHAVRLLRAGDDIAQVASDCGFSDQAHLTRWSRRLLGVTPGQLQRTSISFKTN